MESITNLLEMYDSLSWNSFLQKESMILPSSLKQLFIIFAHIWFTVYTPDIELTAMVKQVCDFVFVPN